MRTVLCTRAGRLGLGLALVAGLGAAVALPAAAASERAPVRQSRPEVAPVSSTAHQGPQSAAVLGPAVKYVRDADGTIRHVR